MRKVWVVLCILGVCVGLLLVGIRAFVDVNQYRPQIEGNLRQKFNRDVELGDLSLSYFPPGFRIRNVKIADDPAFGSGSFAVVDNLYVQPRVLPLLRGVLEIDALQLSGPKLELIRERTGAWNFSRLLEGQPQSLRKLRIQDGEVAVTDLLDQGQRSVYDHIDLTVYGYAPRKSFPVDLRIHMPGAENGLFVFKGDAGPLQRELITRTPLDGKLQLQNIALSAVQRFLKVEALADSDATVTGTAQIHNDGVFAANGHLEFRDAQIRGVKMGFPLSADYNVTRDEEKKTVDIKESTLKLDQTSVSVEGTVNSASTPPTLSAHLRTQDGSIAEIARFAAAFGIAFNATTDVTGRANFDVHAAGPATLPILEGMLSAKNVRVTGGEVQEPVELDTVELSFSPTAIQSNEFVAKTGRTNVTAKIGIENYATADPQIRASGSTVNAEIGELVRILRAYGFTGEEGLTGTGSISVNVAVTGPLKETSHWVYSGSGTVDNAMVQLPSLAEKSLAVNQANLRFDANSLIIENLRFLLGKTSAQGNITLQDLASPRVEFSLSADHINAAEWNDIAEPNPRSTSKSPGLLARTTGSGQLSVQTVTYDSLVLSNVHAGVHLDRGILTMNPITAGIYNGQEIGTIVVNARSEPATYIVNSKLQGIDANQFLSSISPLKEMLYGVMSASTDGRFSATGNASDVARSMNGQVSMDIADGRLANMDLLHQLATIGKFARTARAVEPFTRLQHLRGDFAITNGIARTENLEAVIQDGSLAANGTIDLVDQSLELQLTAVLSQNYSQTVGGMRIAGLMSTVLPNRQGEFVIPILLTGSLKNPQFAPDFQKIARMKLRNLLPTLANPDKLSTGILEGSLGTKGADQPTNVLQEILKGVFGSGRQ